MRPALGALLTCILLPLPAAAQSGVAVRASVGGGAFVGGDYDNTDAGGRFEGALLFGHRTRWGLGVEYGEYTISGQPEAVVVGSAGLVGELPIAGPLYTELRVAWEAHGFDVLDTRYNYNGVTAGAGLGWRHPLAPHVAADAAVGVMFFSAMNGWANDVKIADLSLSTLRAGARIGLTLTPGGDR